MAIDLGLEEIIKKIVTEAEDIAIEATVEAAKKAQKDIEVYAKRYIGIYYGEYKPIWYKRTKHLVNSIVPYLSPSVHRGKSVNVKAGIVYDSGQLNYKINGRDRPDSGWVLDNFLKGIHPAYSLQYTAMGRMLFDNSYYGQDQLKLMKEALDKEAEIVSDYVISAFMNGVAQRMVK